MKDIKTLTFNKLTKKSINKKEPFVQGTKQSSTKVYLRSEKLSH